MEQRMSDSRAVGPSGWAIFAGAMLLLVGVLNLVHGIAALVSPRVVTVTPSGYTLLWDISTWGWVHLILGIILVVVSLGLFAAMEWARWLAIIFATIDAIAAIAFFTSYPLWATLVIALDVIIIYQLSMHWTEPERRQPVT
jgi:hypothetical protein